MGLFVSRHTVTKVSIDDSQTLKVPPVLARELSKKLEKQKSFAQTLSDGPNPGLQAIKAMSTKFLDSFKLDDSPKHNIADDLSFNNDMNGSTSGSVVSSIREPHLLGLHPMPDILLPAPIHSVHHQPKRMSRDHSHHKHISPNGGTSSKSTSRKVVVVVGGGSFYVAPAHYSSPSMSGRSHHGMARLPSSENHPPVLAPDTKSVSIRFKQAIETGAGSQRVPSQRFSSHPHENAPSMRRCSSKKVPKNISELGNEFQEIEQ